MREARLVSTRNWLPRSVLKMQRSQPAESCPEQSATGAVPALSRLWSANFGGPVFDSLNSQKRPSVQGAGGKSLLSESGQTIRQFAWPLASQRQGQALQSSHNEHSFSAGSRFAC